MGRRPRAGAIGDSDAMKDTANAAVGAFAASSAVPAAGLFGAVTSTTTPATPSSFSVAAPTTPSTTAFGAPAFGAPAFGAAASPAPAAPTATTGFGAGLFGASTPASSSAIVPTGSTTGLFGSTTPAATTPGATSGLFAPTTTASTGFTTGFGTPSAGTSSVPGAPAATSATPKSFSSFKVLGGPPASAAPPSTAPTSMFGLATTPAPAPAPASVAAGSKEYKIELPGSSTVYSVSSTLGGAAPEANAGLPIVHMGKALGMQVLQIGVPAPAAGSESALQQLRALQMAYVDENACEFKALLYNVVDPAKLDAYVRPAHIPASHWAAAERRNPSPSTLVPAPVLGLKQLLERMKAQATHADKLQGHAETLSSSLGVLTGATRSSGQMLQQCCAEQHQLQHRMLRIGRKLEVLRCMNVPIQPKEADLRKRLEAVAAVLSAPDEFKGRLRTVADGLRRQELEQQQQPVVPAVALRVTDREAVYKALEGQRDGLQTLTRILQRDLRDIAIMKEGLEKRASKRRAVDGSTTGSGGAHHRVGYVY